MREQVCKYMCPYARFQSAMFDNDTIIVTYDEARGEPRGACAEVCDTVMDKVGYERGLVKYSTQNAMNNHWSRKVLQRILRPRVIIYAAVLSLLVGGLLTILWLRTPFQVDVVRDRGVMSRLTDDGMLANVYRLQIMNGTELIQHYQLSVSGLNGLELETQASDADKNSKDEEHNGAIEVKPAESRWLIVDLKIPDGTVEAGSHKIEFQIKAIESNQTIDEKSIFLVPRS